MKDFLIMKLSFYGYYNRSNFNNYILDILYGYQYEPYKDSIYWNTNYNLRENYNSHKNNKGKFILDNKFVNIDKTKDIKYIIYWEHSDRDRYEKDKFIEDFKFYRHERDRSAKPLTYLKIKYFMYAKQIDNYNLLADAKNILNYCTYIPDYEFSMEYDENSNHAPYLDEFNQEDFEGIDLSEVSLSNLRYIGNKAFYKFSKPLKLNIVNTNYREFKIGEDAFSEVTDKSSISIQANEQKVYIFKRAFHNCNALLDISFNNSDNMYIYEKAFFNSSNEHTDNYELESRYIDNYKNKLFTKEKEYLKNKYNNHKLDDGLKQKIINFIDNSLEFVNYSSQLKHYNYQIKAGIDEVDDETIKPLNKIDETGKLLENEKGIANMNSYNPINIFNSCVSNIFRSMFHNNH